jgi:hypothetical protein
MLRVGSGVSGATSDEVQVSGRGPADALPRLRPGHGPTASSITGPAAPVIFSFCSRRYVRLPEMSTSSAIDAVDGSSTGTRVPSNWVLLLRARDSQGPADTNGSGQGNRFRHCKVGFSGLLRASTLRGRLSYPRALLEKRPRQTPEPSFWRPDRRNRLN